MGFLLPKQPSTNTEDPDIGEIEGTNSTYGRDIPKAWGTVRLGGNVVWQGDIVTEKTVTRTNTGGKGGGGGATNTHTSKSHFLDFAVAFAEGEANEVLRIWSRGELIYDKTDAANTNQDIKFRFYPGTETQEPDSLISEVHGTSSPAFRGLCYIVFERFPLDKNSIPSLTAEINFQETASDNLTTETQSVSNNVEGDFYAVDYIRNRIYVERDDSSAIDVYSLSNLTFIQSINHMSLLGIDPHTGHLIGHLSNQDTLMNGFTGATIFQANNGSDDMEQPTVPIRLTNEAGTSLFWVSGNTDSSAPELYIHKGSDNTIDTVISGTASDEYLAPISDGGPNAYTGFIRSTEMDFYRMSVTDIKTGRAEATLVKQVLPTDLAAGATFKANKDASTVYVPSDDTIIVTLELVIASVDTPYIFKMGTDGSIKWSKKIPFIKNTIRGNGYDRIVGNFWAFHDGNNKIIKVSLLDGTIDNIYDGVNTVSGLGDTDATWYDEQRDAIYAFEDDANGTALLRHTLSKKSTSSVEAREIVRDVLSSSGISENDLEVDGLTQTLDGFMSSKRAKSKRILRPLTDLLQVDVIEEDGKAKFINRGGSSVASIAETKFAGEKNTTEFYKEKRIQESEIPQRIDVSYIEKDNDYQPGVGSASRQRANQSVLSDATKEINLPVVSTAQTVKRLAESQLYTKWLERSIYDFSLPPEYMYLSSADIVTVTLDNGFSFRARIIEFDIGANYKINVRVVRENTGQYTSTASADPGTNKEIKIEPKNFAEGFILDVPLLRDFHATGGTAHRLYFTASDYGQGSWPGADLFRSKDGTSFAEVQQEVKGCAWGYVLTPPGSPPLGFYMTDNNNAISVKMVSNQDRIASITNEQLLNGGNAAAIIKDNGEVGIIQFQTAVLESDGSFTLSVLLRGRRGTEHMDTGYVGGERFLLLENDATEPFTVPLESRGNTEFFKTVTFGSDAETVPVVSKLIVGRDLQPLSPVHAKATIDGSDIDITWIRRTRIGGEVSWTSTSEVPLSEETEKYELEIKNLSDAVLRTITGLTSPEYTYLSADITTDFGGIPSEFKVSIYQISAVVGRGVAGNFTLKT